MPLLVVPLVAAAAAANDWLSEFKTAASECKDKYAFTV